LNQDIPLSKAPHYKQALKLKSLLKITIN
jgi:hypothetical protein